MMTQVVRKKLYTWLTTRVWKEKKYQTDKHNIIDTDF
jgi:hypothetical protein